MDGNLHRILRNQVELQAYDNRLMLYFCKFLEESHWKSASNGKPYLKETLKGQQDQYITISKGKTTNEDNATSGTRWGTTT